MFLKVLVVGAMALGLGHAWPISPLEDYLRGEAHEVSVKCGDDYEYKMEKERVRFVFADSTDDVIPANCYVNIRIAELDLEAEKIGVWVDGTVDLSPIGGESDDECTSSSLTVADEDDDDDEMGSKEIYCGQRNVTFHTTEDTITFTLQVGSTGALGTGFSLLIEPHHICGGLIESSTVISTPDYPQPYPKDINCFWYIKGDSVTLNFESFDVFGKNGKCKDFLTIINKSKRDTYCFDQLDGKTKSYNNMIFLEFRSLPQQRDNTGFKCSVTIGSSKKQKSELLAKFYKH